MATRMSPSAGSMLTRKSMINPRSTKYDSRKSMKSLAPMPVIPITMPRPVPTGASKRTCDEVGRTYFRPQIHCSKHGRASATYLRIHVNFVPTPSTQRPLPNICAHLFQLVADDITDDHVQDGEADGHVPNVVTKIVPKRKLQNEESKQAHHIGREYHVASSPGQWDPNLQTHLPAVPSNV